MRLPYVFPMVLSAFLPGMGQFAKGDWARAMVIWAALWALLVVLVAYPPETPAGLLAMMVAVPLGWIANVADAFWHVPREQRALVRIMMDPTRRHARATMN